MTRYRSGSQQPKYETEGRGRGEERIRRKNRYIQREHLGSEGGKIKAGVDVRLLKAVGSRGRGTAAAPGERCGGATSPRISFFPPRNGVTSESNRPRTWLPQPPSERYDRSRPRFVRRRRSLRLLETHQELGHQGIVSHRRPHPLYLDHFLAPSRNEESSREGLFYARL